MVIRPLNVLSVCSGIGSLDLGVKIAVPAARTVCYLEREAYCVEVLASRMRQGCLDDAPVWADLETFDGKAWRGVVDLVIAGLPCQPYSVAGQQRGHEDERAIWPAFMRIIGDVQPELVFLENVPGIVPLFRPIGDALHGLGYRFTAGLFSADEVGASQKRVRFFCLAHLRSDRRDQGAEVSQGRESVFVRIGEDLADRTESRGRRVPESGGWNDVADADGSGTAMADDQGDGRLLHSRSDDSETGESTGEVRSGRVRRQQRPAIDEQSELRGKPVELASGAERRTNGSANGGRTRGAGKAFRTSSDSGLGHTESSGRPEALGGQACNLGPFPPGPGDRERWATILADHPHLAPAIEPGFRCLVDGSAVLVDEFRVDQLRAGGNGVVALCAAKALSVLLGRL